MANGLGAELAKTHRVLELDMRGHGQTVGPDGKRQRRTPNMDLDVLAFLDAMGIRQTHIGGFSMGGSIASQIMARAPERFITAPGGSGVREVANSEFARMVPPEPAGTAPLDAKARELYQTRQAAEAAKAGVSNNPDNEANLSSQPVPTALPRPPLDLTKINFPILAVVGEFDKPYARTQRLRREAPIFERAILKNSGHLSSYGRHDTGTLSGCAGQLVRHNPKKVELTGTSFAGQALQLQQR